MNECLPDFPRYINQREDGSWHGADDRDGPWRPIPAPQPELPWKTDGPAVPESREPASVAAEVSPSPADRLAMALCRAGGYPGPCHASEICNCCREQAAAVIRELAEQVVPEEPSKCKEFTNEAVRLNRMGTRVKILARAAELEAQP